jgi:hypothetical protein
MLNLYAPIRFQASFKTKGANYKNKPPVPVTIRPKISGKTKISTATCMFFDDQTLNKQIASPIKHANAELHNKHSNQQTPLTSGESVNVLENVFGKFLTNFCFAFFLILPDILHSERRLSLLRTVWLPTV